MPSRVAGSDERTKILKSILFIRGRLDGTRKLSADLERKIESDEYQIEQLKQKLLDTQSDGTEEQEPH